MATLIRNRSITNDSWLRLEAGAPVPADGDVIVPLADWLSQREALSKRAGRTGVWLEPADDPAALAADAARLPLIAVHFPKFADGRGYSTGRLLRERHGFRGELRAFGDIGRDTLLGLERCGFDAMLLRAGEDAALALSAFGEFSEAYQSTAIQPLPLFRRRMA